MDEEGRYSQSKKRVASQNRQRGSLVIMDHKDLRHHGPDVWNALPDHVKHMLFLKSFKRKMKENTVIHYNSTE